VRRATSARIAPRSAGAQRLTHSRHVIELNERLAYWTASHPAWRPNPDWPPEVGCALYRHPNALVLVDPLVESWSWLDEEVARAGVPINVLLTAPWHVRSTAAVSERYEASVWASTAARARLEGLPWLEQLPSGLRCLVPGGVDEGQVAFFIEPERTLVVAELFVGTTQGLEVRPSPTNTDRAGFAESLLELESLPVDRVLVGHGPPVLSRGSEAIADALRRFGV
jgi:glyoxylase-like metal-dependent hydrolase (beta-lactamase superfamily II)